MQVGSMTAFITYAMLIVMAFLMLTMMSVMLPRAGVAADRIDEVLHTEFTIREATEPKHIETSEGVLKFDHVDFTYPGSREPAIHDIDFTAYPGQTTAIIGSTGCGKSTIVNLIPRLYDVTEGSITLDGIDIRELSMKTCVSRLDLYRKKVCCFPERLRPTCVLETPKQRMPGSSGSTDCPGGRIYRRKTGEI